MLLLKGRRGRFTWRVKSAGYSDESMDFLHQSSIPEPFGTMCLQDGLYSSSVWRVQIIDTYIDKCTHKCRWWGTESWVTLILQHSQKLGGHVMMMYRIPQKTRAVVLHTRIFTLVRIYVKTDITITGNSAAKFRKYIATWLSQARGANALGLLGKAP